MSEKITFIAGLLPLKDGDKKTRIFIPSQNINVFPCSRRGQIIVEAKKGEATKLNCDPEARLNTERTNRLRTSINGFTDSFIDSFIKNKDENGNELETGALVFALAGYRIEIKEFNPVAIATALDIKDGTIYAHLSLHDGIPFGVANYYTEILYRQSTQDIEHNYIDVKYTDSSTNTTSDFFMGVSFTTEEAYDTILVDGADKPLEEANLPLFDVSKNENDSYNVDLVQTSLLPKVEHDTEPDSIKLSGDFTVEHTKDNGDKQTSFKVTKDKTTLGPTVMSSLIVGEKADGDKFLDGTIKVKEKIETPTLEATESIKTPALDVKSIENTVDTTGVNINDNLNVATGRAVTVDTVNVNTINGRQENGAVTVESPVTVKNSLTTNNVQIKDQGQVPALELYHFKNGPYQLRFKFNTAPTIIEEE